MFTTGGLRLVGTMWRRSILNNQHLARSVSFSERMENKQHEKAKKQFESEINFMASKPNYTLLDYKQRILDGLAKATKGMAAKLMTGADQQEASLLKQRKILNAMFETELLNPEELTCSFF